MSDGVYSEVRVEAGNLNGLSAFWGLPRLVDTDGKQQPPDPGLAFSRSPVACPPLLRS